MQKIDKNNISGFVMFIVGFVMILVNAISYIFDLNIEKPPFTILGLVFIVIGMKKIKNINK